MMSKDKLRKADFLTSIILILFALWVLQETLKMPMKDTFAGVQNVWYVSPALFPLGISIAIFLLGTMLLIHSIKCGGGRQFIEGIKIRNKGISDSNVRFFSILLALISFVYLNIPRIDFFLSILIFLIFFISVFYFDNKMVSKKLIIFYIAGNIFLLILFLTGIADLLNQLFEYSMDVVALLFFISYTLYTHLLIQNNPELQKKFRVTLIMTIITPLILCPAFKYFLLVPLPKEGGIIGIMNLIRYSLR